MTAKEAAIKAKDFLIEILGDDASAIMLEEVELDENGRFWYITLSYLSGDVTPLQELTKTYRRIYKKFKIHNVSDGEVVDMKIRELEHAK